MKTLPKLTPAQKRVLQRLIDENDWMSVGDLECRRTVINNLYKKGRVRRRFEGLTAYYRASELTLS